MPPWGGNTSAHGEWERVRHWLVYNRPGPARSARVHPAVTGSEVSGSWVFLKKICEAELK